ncbi:MAG: ribosome-binding factor A [Candidatus Paceibacterota bacterium]
MSFRQEKLNNQIKEVVATFLEEESNNLSLITVTSVDISPDMKMRKY